MTLATGGGRHGRRYSCMRGKNKKESVSVFFFFISLTRAFVFVEVIHLHGGLPT